MHNNTTTVAAQSVRTCSNCREQIKVSDNWGELVEGWGLGSAAAHMRCMFAESAIRRQTAAFVQLGWAPRPDRTSELALTLDLPYWLLQEGLECYLTEDDEVAALIPARNVSHDVLLALVFLATEHLVYTLLWDAPWIERHADPWVAFTLATDKTTQSVRATLPPKACFVCGSVIPSGRFVDFRGRGLGRAHFECLAQAREIAWYELAEAWGLIAYNGPFCVHCIGKSWTNREREYHLAQCPHTGRRSAPALDHLRVWTVAEQSAWTSIVPAGSLLATSEPYEPHSVSDGTEIVEVADTEFRVLRYSDVQIHNPDSEGFSSTILHVWTPAELIEAAAT